MTFRYVAIGDSISEGIGDTPWPDGTPRGWTDRLAEHLTRAHDGVEYANLAVRGSQAEGVRTGQLPGALSLRPRLTSISAGMNDLLRPRCDLARLQDNLHAMAAELMAVGSDVLLLAIPDVGKISPAGRLIASRRERYNAMLHAVADETGAAVLSPTGDSIFEDPRAWSDDRLHLSPLGHERLAAGAAATLGLDGHDGWSDIPQGGDIVQGLRAELRWFGTHVVPWIGRRVRGRSSGDGRDPKRPALVPVRAPEKHSEAAERSGPA